METYNPNYIKSCIAEIRLLISDSEEHLTDETVHERIKEYVFSDKKAQCCSHKENIALAQRIFLSLRKEMLIEAFEIKVLGKFVSGLFLGSYKRHETMRFIQIFVCNYQITVALIKLSTPSLN